MNNRQIELQNIIRNLENKILIQRQQIKILSQRSDKRIRQIEEDHSRKLVQKQRLIEYLTVELDKDRQLMVQEQFLYDSKRNREKDEIFKEYERYKLKSTDLEKKLQGIIEKYQLQKKQLENQLKKLQEREYDESFSKAEMESSIEKLNKFYNQSRVEQPKRKQLLQTAEKISNFIHKSQDKNKNQLEDLLSFIKSHLECFKGEVVTNLTHVSEFEEQMMKSKKDVLNEIRDIVKEQNKNKNEMLQSNQKLYEILRKQKSNLQIQRINEQERQLSQLKKRYDQRKQQLQSRIKQLQGERKTLLLGFTELKTLNQTRQKTYKQQINALKRTIQGLMQNSQQRQLQFEKQMKVLHDQLTSISERYYQNIEMPLTKMTNRLDGEIKTARVQLQKLSENRGFMKMIQNLEQIMQRYITQKTNTQIVGKQLGEYVQKSKYLVDLAQQIYTEQSEKQIYGRQIEKQEVCEPQGGMESKINSLEANLKQVQNRQRQNKLVYELNTAKKFNKKLKQYCDNLEVKISNSANERNISPLKKSKSNLPATKSTPKTVENTVKIMQLQSQIERLKLINNDYAQQYCFQLSNIKSHIEKLTGTEVKDDKNFTLFQKGVKDITIFNEKLQKYLNQQSSHVNQIRQILSNVNKVLLKPVEIFDGFVEKITNCYHPSFIPPKVALVPPEKSPNYLFSNLQEVYKELYTKRQQNNSQTTKLFIDFIKLLRETAPQHIKSHQKSSMNIESERDHLDKSRLVAKQSLIEKKIKQLQNVRLKSRQQLIRRLQRIEEALRNIENKYSKRNFANVGKIQELMGRKLDEIKQKCMQKLRQTNSQINQITGNIIKDMKNRLKTCVNQNEGLMKQIQLLQLHRKKQESK